MIPCAVDDEFEQVDNEEVEDSNEKEEDKINAFECCQEGKLGHLNMHRLIQAI
jgi:hypothetical protein